MKFTDFLDKKDEFVEKIQNAIRDRATTRLSELKKEYSAEFLKPVMDDNDEDESN